MWEFHGKWQAKFIRTEICIPAMSDTSLALYII